MSRMRVQLAAQLISLTLPKVKYDAPPLMVRQRLRDEVFDLCEPDDDVAAPQPSASLL